MSDLLDDVVAAAGLTVFGAASVPGSTDARSLAAPAPVPSGPALPPDLLPRIAELRAGLRSRGLDHVVLCGAGAPVLAAEAIARTLGVDLTVLDTADPHQVRATLGDRLHRTVVVLAGHSGDSGSDAYRRACQQAFEDAGHDDVGRRFVIVTAPGSPPATLAAETGAHLFLAEPSDSAFSAYALVPAGLAGADVAALLDQAAPPPVTHVAAGFALTPLPAPAAAEAAGDPGLALGAAIAAGARAGRDKLALASDGTGLDGLADWIALLVADRTALVPVVLENPSAWGHEGPDVLSVTLGGAVGTGLMPGGGIAPDLAVNGPLGAQFAVWERAVAVAAGILGAGEDAGEPLRQDLLDAGVPPEAPAFVEGAVEVYGDVSATTLVGAVDEFARAIGPGGYLAVSAFLDRVGDASAAGVREALGARVPRVVTLRWGRRPPANPAAGSFLQLTGAVTDDLPVPGREYTFGELQVAQAAAERRALAALGRPVLRLHLTDRATGAEQLLATLGG
ncbi:glucose-6-phosphate isomerase [Dactylosporangium sucinum]|uniref:Glucose-6-phosphate isomerase n=1 Tax=Dactylosporangium sucinum TaxID=1424081 RepID=A0A917WKL5_9ACTN|nr:glucose-6-phosphate isomerase [Dactylosporangium sucinum]GGM12742.1 glucose-6-phosphate isomerase [Dactylosporangium sucinum]